MSEPIPSRPRWNRSYALARKFMKNENINWLPVRLLKIYQNREWLVATAKEGEVIFPNYDWISFYWYGIDAVTYKKRGHYITIYNDNFPPDRIRWTLAHEIGHIALGHLDDFEETKMFRSGLTDDSYSILEQEAHAFASELLTPSVLLLACRILESDNIQRVCRISKEAALKRELTLKKRKQTGVPLTEANFYRKQFQLFLNQKTCANCHHYFFSEKANYCPVCGSQSINWGEGENGMVYQGFQIDENHKAVICPRCQNEEINPLYPRCKICGTYLFNQCTNDSCNMGAEGNARHCISCGSYTTFFQQNLLVSWEREFNRINEGDEDDPIF